MYMVLYFAYLIPLVLSVIVIWPCIESLNFFYSN